jgi:3-oxoacyl-[acyl-carrier-protein] synthase I
MTQCYIAKTGVICAIGSGTAQLSASFRAGLSGYVQSPVIGRNSEPLVMALVPESDLEALDGSLDAKSLSDRERRMLRLGGAALRQLSVGIDKPLPMFLALPEARPGTRARSQRDFIEHLSTQAALPIDARASQYFELGRAGGLYALQAAVAALGAGMESALVGGIDTCLDLTSLARLDRERRLLGSDIKDGFVPGEGSAFVVLSRARGGADSACTAVRAVGTAEDPGHRYSDAPALGVGLSAALDDALSQEPHLAPVKTCFAGLNGEHFGAKEWGVAHTRHHDLFDRALFFEHPSDCFGDLGAAQAAVLIALADETMRTQQRPGPMLVWASSDHAPCGCAYLAGPPDMR